MNNQSDWRSRATPIDPLQQQQTGTIGSAQPIPDWKSRATPIHEPETGGETLRRNLYANATRAGEAILGFPGDIRQMGETGVQSLAEKFVPQYAPQVKQALELKNKVMGKVPSTSELRELTKGASKGYLEPRNETEQSIQDFTEKVASIRNPLARIGAGPNLARSIGMAAAGTTGKATAELFGAGHTGQALADVGAMVLAHKFDPKGAEKYKKSLFDKAKTLAPEGAEANFVNSEKKLLALKEELSHGTPDAAKAKVIEQIDGLVNKSYDGRIPLKDLEAAKITLNDMIYSRELKGVKKLLTSVSESVNEGLNNYGKQNPEWGKYWKQANDAHKGLARSKKISDFIIHTVDENRVKSAAAAMAYSFFQPGHIPTAVAGAGALKAAEFAHRLAFSPVLRKRYMELMSESLRENKTGVVKSLQRLSDAL